MTIKQHIFINNPWVKAKVITEIRKYFGQNNSIITFSILWDAARTMLKRKFVTSCAMREGYLKITELTIHLKKIEKNIKLK